LYAPALPGGNYTLNPYLVDRISGSEDTGWLYLSTGASGMDANAASGYRKAIDHIGKLKSLVTFVVLKRSIVNYEPMAYP
jgi:hypothetical protein